MINFVGAGPGAVDLITVRGKALLEEADLIIYAGSLVNPGLLDYAKAGCRIMDSASMTLEEVLAAMKDAEERGEMTVRLHTGDPCLYGAIREQMDILDKWGIAYEYTPGVSSFRQQPRRLRPSTPCRGSASPLSSRALKAERPCLRNRRLLIMRLTARQWLSSSVRAWWKNFQRN